ncbi:MAG: hypothetical protein HOL01_09665 [Planctomycetaceae bacterium]|jgi:hypothetical protein|nr:hypothetical protein [Planctomycetaceae bacterium]MBT6486867.1 hypothetical protein [Planctomycetaceae bacterium]MBT6494804.1 hypothetical protein [Planctomycetaceae bacterium]
MLRRCIAGLLVGLLLPTAIASANPILEFPAIKRITNVRPKANVYKNSSHNKPLVIRNEKDAAKYFAAADVVLLSKQVDFTHQTALVFAWRGSGQDKLTYEVLESYPEQIIFNYTRGRTKDLRPHVYIFALRSNVKSRTGRGKGAGPIRSAEQYIQVEVKGLLKTGILAIGGETTGTTITARGVTWELDFGKRADLRKLTDKLSDQNVIVTGRLNVRRGIEIRQRWIVDVTSLNAAGHAGTKKSGGKNAYLNSEGMFKHAVVLRDSQSGFAGESGHIFVIEPNGAWTKQPFLNKNVRDVEQKGQLTKKQLQELASGFSKHNLLTIPRRLGKPIGANPHVFTVTFGKTQCALILQAGAAVPKPDPKRADAPEQRFASVVRLLQDAMTVE